jgi:hypothetical protein
MAVISDSCRTCTVLASPSADLNSAMSDKTLQNWPQRCFVRYNRISVSKTGFSDAVVEGGDGHIPYDRTLPRYGGGIRLSTLQVLRLSTLHALRLLTSTFVMCGCSPESTSDFLTARNLRPLSSELLKKSRSRQRDQAARAQPVSAPTFVCYLLRAIDHLQTYQ